jgi:hypothetical protein
MTCRRAVSRRLFLHCAALCVLICARSPGLLWAQMATEDRLLYRGWWPRHSVSSGDQIIGPAECAECHPSKAAAQKTTPMARTAVLAADSDILPVHNSLTFEVARIKYRIATTGGKSVYTVTDGTRSISAPLTWAFGDGHIGQSYLYEHDGNFYESRMSYFGPLGTLDFTPGRKLTEPRDLEQAMARPVDGAELVRCFACHSTGSTIGDRFERNRTIPGITCEACHGPGLKHATAQKAARLQGQVLERGQEEDLIFDPGKLSPVDAVDFCGVTVRGGT